MKQYDARTIAHYIIDSSTRQMRPISNLQLHKILYLIQAAYIGTFGRMLFEDSFEAWQYGPVIPRLYDEYSFYAGRRIERRYDSNEFLDIDSADKDLIDGAVEMLSEKDPWTLVNMTHKPGEPWDKVWRGGSGNHKKIDNRLLFESYARSGA